MPEFLALLTAGLSGLAALAVLRRRAETAPAGKTPFAQLYRNATAADDAAYQQGAMAAVRAVRRAQQFEHSGPFKALVDIVASFALLVALAPLLIAVAVLVRMDSPGPIFYRQQRVGHGGRIFSIIKFRTMIEDAEPNGPQFADVDDSRITRIGTFLRRFRIDEIPQAINVLRGEMSFVGPRPERPEFVALLEREIPNYHARHAVKPGITGWAQVRYVYTADVEGARTKLRYDLEYIRRYSPFLDLLIMLMTVRVALFGLGGR